MAAGRRTRQSPLRLLVLAGTADARRLASALAVRADVEATASLAGATAAPAPYPIPTRRGGFGGAQGLAQYLADERFDAVIDATHPFAQTIAVNAERAAAELDLPLLKVLRPEWRPEPGDRWTSRADPAAAAAALPAGAVAFLATGPGSIAPFAARTDLRLALRVVDDPPAGLPGSTIILRGRPPFPVEEEIAALRRVGATHLVAKNSGGPAGAAKLTAARKLDLPVVMIERPPRAEAALTVSRPEQAIAWLDALLGAGLHAAADGARTAP